MSDNVLIFPIGDMTVDVLLSKLPDWGMTECVVVGLDAERRLVVGGTAENLGRTHWLLSQGVRFVMDNGMAERAR